MAKFPTFPTLYDNAPQLNISKLKEWEYLIPHQIKSGVLSWTTNGNTHTKISINVNTIHTPPYIVLNYYYNDKPINYKIYINTVKSNLGKGVHYYFICPATKKQARKLYLINGYFLHRTAFNGCMYSKQTESKLMRFLNNNFVCMYSVDEVYKEIYQPYFKKFYKGKPTKRYLKLLECIKKADNVDYESIENILFK